ncbi:MAG: hypothetical protein IPK66_09495 [Rhodospirillales bacterium]|nr:hypothetical protein [Rhodospirillales bacterium]
MTTDILDDGSSVKVCTISAGFLRFATLAMFLSVLGACGGLAGGSHSRSAAEAAFPPKPRDCKIDVYRDHPPGRAFNVVGHVVVTIEQPPGTPPLDDDSIITSALPQLREGACDAGADALVDVVVRPGTGQMAVVTAQTVRYSASR